MFGVLLLVSAAIATIAVVAIDSERKKVRREQFIRGFMFPRGLFDKLAAARPGLAVKDMQLVARGLRQFFLAFQKSGCRHVAMPSQVVDDLWHEFILFKRDYEAFCAAAFGTFLHHTPAVKMGKVKTDNEGLRRVWWFSCLEENINPRRATRLPLLFAIDQKLGIENGFAYDLDCRRKRAAEAAAGAGAVSVQCASDFKDSSIDGTLDGLGDNNRQGGCGGSGVHEGSHGGGADGGADGGGSGCSGGCGGGCGGGS